MTRCAGRQRYSYKHAHRTSRKGRVCLFTVGPETIIDPNEAEYPWQEAAEYKDEERVLPNTSKNLLTVPL